jgi:hypothetical protein
LHFIRALSQLNRLRIGLGLLLLRLSPLRLLLLSLRLVAPSLSIVADRKYLADCVLDRPRVSFLLSPDTL